MQLHGTTGLKDKLSHSGYYGINITKSTLEDFLNIDIDYFMELCYNKERKELTDLEKILGLIGTRDKKQIEEVEEAKKLAKEETKTEIALNLLDKGISIDIISETTGLSIDEINTLKEK